MAAVAGPARRPALLDRPGRPGRLPALRRQHAELPDPGGVRRVRRPLAQRPGRRLEPDPGRRVRPVRRAGPGPGARRARRSPSTRTSPNAFPSLWDGDWQTNFTQDRRDRDDRGGPTVRTFRVALTGDFLDEPAAVAYGDIGLGLLDGRPYVRRHFLDGAGPAAGRPGLLVRGSTRWRSTPEHIQGVDGLVVLRPWVKREHVRRGCGRPGRDRPLGGGLRQDRPGRLHRARRGRVQRPDGPEPLDGLVGAAVHAGPGQAAAASRSGSCAQGRWDLQADGDGRRDPGPDARASSAWATAAGSWCGWSRRSRCASSPTRRTPTRPRPQALGVALTSLEEVLARVGLRQPALPADRRRRAA